MELWPPSFFYNDEISESAGAFKVPDWHCVTQIKNSHGQKIVEST